jgi:hypothetical protein
MILMTVMFLTVELFPSSWDLAKTCLNILFRWNFDGRIFDLSLSVFLPQQSFRALEPPASLLFLQIEEFYKSYQAIKGTFQKTVLP